MPHSTRYRQSILSHFGGRPPREPRFVRWRAWSASSGMVQWMHVCAGRGGFAGGVRLVGAYSIGTDTRPARPDAEYADLLQHGFELRRVPALPGRHHDRLGLPALLDCQMELGGESTARASRPMIRGLGEDTARGSFCRSPCLRAPAACRWARHTVESALRSPHDRTPRIGQGWS